MTSVLHRSFLSLLFLYLSAAFSGRTASAQDIYRWEDAGGTVHFSTTPSSESNRPASLPDIGRESLDRKIQELKDATPPNCSSHGGVDCSLGPDEDGSVICLDEYRGALLPFRFHCLETRLNGTLQGVLKESHDRVALDSLSAVSWLLPSLEGLEVVVRNTAGVEATGVKVELNLGEGVVLTGDGPAGIEPYAAAAYMISLPLIAQRAGLSGLEQASVRISCTNCSAVTRMKH